MTANPGVSLAVDIDIYGYIMAILGQFIAENKTPGTIKVQNRSRSSHPQGVVGWINLQLRYMKMPDIINFVRKLFHTVRGKLF